MRTMMLMGAAALVMVSAPASACGKDGCCCDKGKMDMPKSDMPKPAEQPKK